MKYKMMKRANPQDRSQEKWYARPINEGKISKSDIAKEIVAMSSLTRGDVSNVIENLLDILPKYLMMGKTVYLGEFGSLRSSFSSEGVENPEDFKTHQIGNIRVIFTPGVEFKQALSNVKFEKSE